MQKVVVTLAIAASLFFTVPFIVKEKSLTSQPVSKFEVVDIKPVKLPEVSVLQPKSAPLINKKGIKKLVLESKNVVVFRGVVTSKSVAATMVKLREVSKKLSKNEEIYLVLDTPGGSIFDGLDFIDFVHSLPQKVNTVTLFAASMGFQFAQNLEKRYITRTGILMSHRGAVGGLGGQIDGELESRYKLIRRSIDYMDLIASERMSMSVEDYKKLILNEYWVFGFDAVKEKAADEQVLVACGNSLNGTEIEELQTIFGKITLTFSKCPLVKYPVKVDFSNLYPGSNKKEAKNYVKALTRNKKLFFEKYVKTNLWSKIQK